MDYVARENNLNVDYRVLINPTGRFVIGDLKEILV